MTASFPIQKFRLGDQVRRLFFEKFIIDAVCVEDGCVMYRALGLDWVPSDDLTLSPERPDYVASERRVFGRAATISRPYETIPRYQPELYRCETDAELAARHAVERAAYDAEEDDK